MYKTQGHPSAIKTLMDLRASIHLNTVIVGDLNTTLSLIDRSYRQKVKKKFQNYSTHWIKKTW
jgi:hypothetical protein